MKKLLASILIPLVFITIPTAVFAHTQATSKTVFYACENAQGKIDPNSITQNDSLLQSGSCTGSDVVVTWSVTGPKGDQGIQGAQGPKGDTGSQGLQGNPGSNGTNGSNVLTSESVPTGACTSGDTDIDLSTGEVYTCTSSAWVDTTHTVKGDKGDIGPQGLQGNPGPTGPKGDSGLPFSHIACTEVLTGSAQQENRIFCQSGIEADGGLIYHAAINAAQHRIIVGTPIAQFPNVDWSNVAVTYVEFTSGFHAEYHIDNVVRIYNPLNQRVF